MPRRNHRTRYRVAQTGEIREAERQRRRRRLASREKHPVRGISKSIKELSNA